MQALRYKKEVCLCGVFYSLQFYGPGNSTTLHNRIKIGRNKNLNLGAIRVEFPGPTVQQPGVSKKQKS